MIILDTNVISEIMRTTPDAGVMRWLRVQPVPETFTTAITEAEIFKGIELMASGKRHQELLELAQPYFSVDMATRILAFDSSAARWFGIIFAQRKQRGLPITPLDAQIAAITRSHSAILATRNISDFEGCGIELLDPWKAG
jgi:toxin FitB